MSDPVVLPEKSSDELIANPAELGTLLEQMHGFDMPPPVSWWPLAPGWWIVAVLTVASAGFLIARGYKMQRERQQAARAPRQTVHQQTIGLLDQHIDQWRRDDNTQHYLMQVNSTLKRLVLSTGQVPGAASASGEDWIHCLANYSASPLPRQTLQTIAVQCYRPQPQADAMQIHEALHRWIQSDNTGTG